MNSIHNAERDRIARECATLEFTCAACQEQRRIPPVTRVATEVRYKGLLRADIGAFDTDGAVLGVIEVIRTHPPSPAAFAAQSELGFTYYREMNFRSADNNDAYWLCSHECRQFYMTMLRTGEKTHSSWEPGKCDWCGTYYHQNPLSQLDFFDWSEPGDYTVLCIHCAAASSPSGLSQWRSPGELAGGDPRQWTPFDDKDEPAALYLAFCEAAFWNKVWTERVTHLAWNTCGHCQVVNEDPLSSEYGHSWWCSNCDAENKWPPTPPYNGSNHPEAEDATSRRLPLVNNAFDAGDWHQGSMLLLPVAAPGWASYEDEPERMLAFQPENCKGVARAWGRLLEYRRSTLPVELKTIMASPESYCDSLPPDSMGRSVPSPDYLEELERDEVESSRKRREKAQMLREDAQKKQENHKTMQQEKDRKREEQQMWMDLNKLIGGNTER